MAQVLHSLDSMDNSLVRTVKVLVIMFATGFAPALALAGETGVKTVQYGIHDLKRVCMAPDFASEFANMHVGCIYLPVKKVDQYIKEESQRNISIGGVTITRKPADFTVSKETYRYVTRCLSGVYRLFSDLTNEPYCDTIAVTKDEFLKEVEMSNRDLRQNGGRVKPSTAQTGGTQPEQSDLTLVAK